MADYTVAVNLGGFPISAGVILVTAYGATGDGVTDDLSAIQSAIDAVEAAGGGEVLFPVGDYYIDGHMVIDSDRVTLRGTGGGSRILADDDAGKFALKISSADVTVKDLTFVGNTTLALTQSIAAAANECISLLSGAVNTEITGCRFTGVDATHGFNVQIRGASGCTGPRITNNYFDRVVGTTSGYGYGIQLANVVGAIVSHNEMIQTATTGRHHIYFSDLCTDCIASDNRLVGGTSAMISLYCDESSPLERCNVTNNVLDGLGSGGGSGGAIEAVDEILNCSISGNIIEDVDTYGIKLEGDGGGNDSCSDNTVIGNTIKNCDSHGIFISGASYTAVIGNKVYESAGDAIALASVGSDSVTGTSVIGNHVSGSSHTYAVQLSSGHGAVIGNHLTEGSSGTFENLSSTRVVQPNYTLDGPQTLIGKDDPEGVHTADPGSIFQRTDGSSGNQVYVKDSGTGTNTGWAAVKTASTVLGQTWGLPVTASSGVHYIGGFYQHIAQDNDFDPAPINLGTANASYAAHVYFVAAAGATDTQLTITGTSIADTGSSRDATPDTEVISLTDASANTYYESSKKWLGQVTIQKTAGTNRLCNYGWCKYWDNRNGAFTVKGCEALWDGNISNSLNIEILHHNSTGWTYVAGANPATPPTAIASMDTDHGSTEVQVVNGEQGAWKRTDLSTAVAGDASEGVIVRVTTGQNNLLGAGQFTLDYTDDG
jgi:parallel beta-helix repeat protein